MPMPSLELMPQTGGPNLSQKARSAEVATEHWGRMLQPLLLIDGTGSCGKSVVGIGADQAYGSDH